MLSAPSVEPALPNDWGGCSGFRPLKQAEPGAQAKFSPKGRERDLARAPAGTTDVPSEHLLRQAPKRGYPGFWGAASGASGFGYFRRSFSS